jgi:zinc and cadmium transporter
MNPLIITLLVIMATSLVGVLVTYRFAASWLARHTRPVTLFISGVLLVSGFSMFREAIHLGGWLIGILSLFLGILIFFLMHHLFPEGHSHSHTDRVSHKGAWRMLLGDALHNIGDGIVIATAFMIDVRIGITATLGIFMHEVLQEISEFFILKKFGYSTRKALLINFLVSSTIVLGAGIAYVFGSSYKAQALLLGISSGLFLFVVLHDIRPFSLSHKKEPGALGHMVWFVVGALLLFGIQQVLPHEHNHEEEGHAHMHDHAHSHPNHIHSGSLHNEEDVAKYNITEQHEHEHHHE